MEGEKGTREGVEGGGSGEQSRVEQKQSSRRKMGEKGRGTRDGMQISCACGRLKAGGRFTLKTAGELKDRQDAGRRTQELPFLTLHVGWGRQGLS